MQIRGWERMAGAEKEAEIIMVNAGVTSITVETSL